MKSDTPKVERVNPDLDIEEHVDAQEKGWQFQAIGMYCILVFVVSAAVGLFGNGIVSKSREFNGDANVEYQQFLRYEAKSQFRIQAISKQGLKLSFPAEYLAKFEIVSIVPQPDKTRFEESRVLYSFDGHDQFDITIYSEPKHLGNVEGSLNVNDSRFHLTHFIFP